MNTSLNTLRETRKSLVSALADTEQTLGEAREKKAWSVFGHAVLVKGQIERELSRINGLIAVEESKERAAFKRAQAASAQAAREAMSRITARKRAESESRLKSMRERQILIERMMNVLTTAQNVAVEASRISTVVHKRAKKVRVRRRSGVCLFALAGLSING